MLIIILFLVAGSALVYISKYNFVPVSLNFGTYTIADIPLFYVIVGSVLFGLILSYLIYLVHTISTSLKLHGKNRELKKDKEEISELIKRVNQLELEKEKLKSGSEFDSTD